ncbi:AMP-binding protein [Salinisphaera sp. SPP-AMP-43]|uniref:AMP-binding protein n=1 Tax=Salinisphaera sp. SPP-AMP-43 TaxID=3121288 RepID=UPI003C6E3C90
MADMSSPLIADYQPERVFAWRAGQPVQSATALADIQSLARALTGQSAFFNLCNDRYLFTVLFAAGCQAGALNLLPQTRHVETLARIRSDYPKAEAIDDAWVDRRLSERGAAKDEALNVPENRAVAVVFTSGSTGQPNPQIKRWGDLARGSALLRQRFFTHAEGMNIVASVPPQHMYGLENSVLLALHAGFAADNARPSMPWQIADALARLPEPRVLFTTPLQLKACFESGVALPSMDRIISATAPLSAELAAAAEQVWATEVHEIYGSSETGSIASRETAHTRNWRLYDGLTLEVGAKATVRGGQLPEPVTLDDALQAVDADHFRLLGRARDLIKVAGKRMSLAELTAQLLAIDGVQDAAVFASPESATAERPVALVVAPTRSTRELGAALARRVDPVFVPRPLLKVAELPRNATGKITRADLASAWGRARQTAKART